MCSGMPWNISDGKIQIFGKREHPQWKIKIGKILIRMGMLFLDLFPCHFYFVNWLSSNRDRLSIIRTALPSLLGMVLGATR